MPRAVVADGHPLVRAGLRSALETGEIVVVSEVGDSTQLLSAVLDERPDVIVVSGDLPGGGIACLEHLAAQGVHIPSIVLAQVGDEDELLRAVAAGARGFLLGGTDPERLPHAVKGVLAGEAAIPRQLVAVMADELGRLMRRRNGASARVRDQLSDRELQVLRALGEGGEVRDIAERLGIEPATVRRHVASATKRLGASDRAAAVRMLADELGS